MYGKHSYSAQTCYCKCAKSFCIELYNWSGSRSSHLGAILHRGEYIMPLLVMQSQVQDLLGALQIATFKI